MGGWDEYYAEQAKERWRSMPWHEKLLANVTLALVLMPVVFFA